MLAEKEGSAPVAINGFDWPVTLAHGDIELRPLKRSDKKTFEMARQTNRQWLEPWEATNPSGDGIPLTYRRLLMVYRQSARDGSMLPLAITHSGVVIGQVNVGSVAWGSVRSGSVGYWISEDYAGRGITPLSVAMVIDYCLMSAGLHRIEINIRPENERSLAVVRKLGLRDEGLRKKYIHIDGQWCDHRTFAVTADEIGIGLIQNMV